MTRQYYRRDHKHKDGEILVSPLVFFLLIALDSSPGRKGHGIINTGSELTLIFHILVYGVESFVVVLLLGGGSLPHLLW